MSTFRPAVKRSMGISYVQKFLFRDVLTVIKGIFDKEYKWSVSSNAQLQHFAPGVYGSNFINKILPRKVYTIYLFRRSSNPILLRQPERVFTRF
jgi:hypothetical protein